MRIYLRDYTYNAGASDWATALSGGFGLHAADYAPADKWAKTAICNQTWEQPAFRAQDVLVFIHADSDPARAAWVTAAASWMAGNIVFISRPGGLGASTVDAAFAEAGTSVATAKQRVFACYWSVADFGNPQKDEVKNLIAAIKAGDADWHKWLQPAYVPRDVLSWTLLETYGRDVSGADALKTKIQPAAEAELRDRTKAANMALTVENAQAELNRYREDI